MTFYINLIKFKKIFGLSVGRREYWSTVGWIE